MVQENAQNSILLFFIISDHSETQSGLKKQIRDQNEFKF